MDQTIQFMGQLSGKFVQLSVFDSRAINCVKPASGLPDSAGDLLVLNPGLRQYHRRVQLHR